MSSAVDEWQVVGEWRDRLGESPLWHSVEGALYWVDFYGPTVHRLDPADGGYRRWTLGEAATIGSLAFAADGLLVALENGVHVFNTDNERLSAFADPNAGRPGIGYNDAKVDRRGRYWVGTWDLKESAPRGILYRIDAGRRVAIGDSGFTVCNGPAFSPSGEILYFSDSVARRLLAYDVDPATGGLSERRVFAQFGDAEGMPDGLCVDASGALYCAQYGAGRITRYGPEGDPLDVLTLPVRNVTSCCLGGPSLDVLYVTTAEDGCRHPLDGALFARGVAVPGLHEPLYQGG